MTISCIPEVGMNGLYCIVAIDIGLNFELFDIIQYDECHIVLINKRKMKKKKPVKRFDF